MVLLYIIIVLLGLVFGSFVNVLIYRIPNGKSIVSPASACTACGGRLSARDLVPVFSYLFLRGRCRNCGAAISTRYPLVELLTAFVYVLIFIKFGLSVSFFAYAFLMTILLAIFFIDFDHREIPDGLVLTAIAGGVALTAANLFIPMPVIFGDSNWWTPVVGFFSGSVFLLLVALLGEFIFKTDDAMGMGDVKLMAPIGLFLGWKLCLTALFIGIILAGFTSLGLIVLKLKKRKDTIPFGPFIVAGTFTAILWGWGLLKWYMGL
jgi:leader peptidase (prepilin peptidase)/N-methyltransferase